MSTLQEKSDEVDEKVENRQEILPVQPSLEERRLVRRLDVRIMPIACIMYFFAYLDRTNVGNARLQGLPKDALHGDPTGTLFDWVNSAFFFSYILCQIPLSIVSKLCHPRLWLGCASIGWGVCSTLMASGFDFPGLIVARVGLGVFEVGFGPKMPLYLSFFYTKKEMGMRMAYWFGFAAVAGAFGEGLPSIVLGLLGLFILPNRPEETTMLNEQERQLALERVNRGLKADMEHIFAAFKDWRIYAGGVIYFGGNCALASISAFLPTIITTFGYTNALAQLLTVPPYAVAAIFLCLNSYCSDRLQSRGPFIAGVGILGRIGYILLLTVPENNHVRYFAVFCITGGTYTIIGIVIAWFMHNLGSETKRATGIPMYMAIGQCGSVLGSHLYPTTEGPRYIKGFAVTCALEFLAAVVAIGLTIDYRMENARRDREYGKPIPDDPVDTLELADLAPDFRYVP